jgi:hypothetical protein
LGVVVMAGLSLAAARMASAQDPQSAPVPAANSEKPKKVWTNDDVPAAPEGNRAAALAKTGPAKGTTVNRRDAGPLKERLRKLEAQLKDAETQLEELKKFEAGETYGSSGRDARRGVNRATVPEQIQKLYNKRADLKGQISAIYDEARHRGIAPGELR